MNAIRLPWPPKELSPNARLHWARVSKAKKAYRTACWAETLASGVRVSGDGEIALELVFYKPTRRAMDWDNLIARMKAGLDGMADALKINDKHFRLSMKVAEETGGFVLVNINKE